MKNNIELNKQRCEKYPYLIPRNVWDDKIPDDYDYSYIRGDYELPEGWHKLFLQMCEDIRQPLIEDNYLDKFRFSQIKEKYCSMRCYTFGSSKKVQDIISKYEYMSEFICQYCGKPATKISNGGWIENWCDDCFKQKIKPEFQDDEEFEEITFKPWIHVVKWTAEGKRDEYEYCGDEWKRLYGLEELHTLDADRLRKLNEDLDKIRREGIPENTCATCKYDVADVYTADWPCWNCKAGNLLWWPKEE